MVNVTVEKHAIAFPSRIASGYAASPHIYDIEISEDLDNGALVTRGDYISLGTYKQGDAPTFAGIIREQAANGNWYVEVTADTEALFVYMPPISPYTERIATGEKVFFNASGDTVKGYSLIKGDIFELSAEWFSGTPEVNKTLTYTNGKYVVAA